MRQHIRTALVGVAALALAAAGCDRKNTEDNHQATSAISPTASAATAPQNLVTEQTAGKPPLKLKIGQPASFAKGGATLTLTPKSVELTNEPLDIESRTEEKNSCGSWWKVALELKIDVQKDSTWTGWMFNFNAPVGLGGNIHMYEGQYIGDAIGGALTNDPADIGNLLNKAVYDFDADRKQEFHRVLTGVDHLFACKTDGDQNVPSDQRPVALDWSMEIDPNDVSGHWPQLAVWFL